MDVKSIVKKLIKKYKTRNPFELAERMNIIVKFIPMHQEINGIYQYIKRNRFIFINTHLSKSKQKEVCCHELGHAVLHAKLNTTFLERNTCFIKSKFEIEANRFAAELLIDEDEIDPSIVAEMSINQLAQFFGVPKEYLFFKFEGKI